MEENICSEMIAMATQEITNLIAIYFISTSRIFRSEVIILEEKLYPIHEFAKMIRVTPQTLRNWDKKEILIPHCKSSNGYRYYTDTQYRQFLGSSGKKEKIVIG
jgi:hypothetical protein